MAFALVMLLGLPPSQRPWEIVEMPDKSGYGICATRDLAEGELLLCERPLLHLVPSNGKIHATHGLGGNVARCQKLLGTLSQHSGGRSFEEAAAAPNLDDVIETNGFRIAEDGETVVFYSLSLVNHACSPNARFEWDKSASEGRVRIHRSVSAGSEVTINYLQGAPISDIDLRRRHLKEHFGFDCKCATCTAELNRLL